MPASDPPTAFDLMRSRARRHDDRSRKERAIVDEVEVLTSWLEAHRNGTGTISIRGGKFYVDRLGDIVLKKIVRAIEQHVEDSIDEIERAP